MRIVAIIRACRMRNNLADLWAFNYIFILSTHVCIVYMYVCVCVWLLMQSVHHWDNHCRGCKISMEFLWLCWRVKVHIIYKNNKGAHLRTCVRVRARARACVHAFVCVCMHVCARARVHVFACVRDQPVKKWLHAVASIRHTTGAPTLAP